MDRKAESEPGLLDALKLLLATSVLLGGIVGYYYYGNQSVLLRAVGVLVAVGLAILVALQSHQGRTLWRFIQGSRIELRKVVWPTREDTVQTTMVVLVFAAIMGVFFFLLDVFLRWFTGLLTGGGA